MKKKMTCPLCGVGSLIEGVQKIKRTYKGKSFTIQQPGQYCNSCHDGIISPEHRKTTLAEIQEHKARIDGLLPPSQIRRIRKRLYLNQKQAAQVFGGGVNAFSRYERGEIGLTKPLSILLTILDENPHYIQKFIPTDLVIKKKSF